jgi:DNA-binding transcriptional ArsR family regulator
LGQDRFFCSSAIEFNQMVKYTKGMPSIDSLSITFAALADPTRRAILARLALGESSVADLSKPFAMSAPAVTKHLKVLQRAGLVRQGRQAQWRPCQLQAAPLREAADWVAQYRQHWEARLDRLEDYLIELQAAPENPITSTTKSTP